ncbi:hypothetical protein M758_3G266800 [Ceratodon purpureus]|nr:hypothetical protein M758_3G266800 [Ceratodon purpureus]
MAYALAVRSCVLAVVMMLVVAPAHAQTQCNTTLLQAVAANPNLAELAKLIQNSNLANKLNTTDNVTILAPNNAAFNGTGGLYELLQRNNVSLQQVTGQASNSENRAGSILEYHIIPLAAVTAAQLTNGQNVPTSLQGYNLTVSKTNPTPTTTSVTFIGNATNATVVTADVRVCNSIVHIVNHVLLPSSNLSAIPVYDANAPTPGVGTNGASGLAIGTWAFALSGALAAALMM